MNELEQLMTERHAAFSAASAAHFENEALTRTWREANRRYVLARDTRKMRLSASPEPTEALGRNGECRTADRAIQSNVSTLTSDFAAKGALLQ